MIDTLMALWNRGYSGRGIMVSIAFALICISISLLLVTEGSFWASLFAQRPTYPRSIVGTAELTATAQSSGIQPVADNTATFQAPTSTTQPCTTLTPHSAKTPTTHASVTAYPGGHPRKPTVTPTRPQPTPSPIRPTPTTIIPTATPTVVVPPTDTPTPVNTPIPTITPTPVVTPTDTPTPVVSPTDTPTPVNTPIPTNTPTPVVSPTDTPTVGVTPTITVGTTPTGSPIVIITQTRQKPMRGGTPVSAVGAGTGTTGQNGNGGTAWNTDCNRSGTVGDKLDNSSDGSIAAALERDVWLILGGSVGGTLLFYTSMYFITRKKVRKY